MANNQVNLNSDGTIWTKTTPDGVPLIVGRSYYDKKDGQFWMYMGDFKSTEEVPNVYCYYTIGDCLFKRTSIKRIEIVKEKTHRKRADDTRPIFTEIHDGDGELLVAAKSLLAIKNITRGDFKEKYDNDSDMNNSMRAIETGDSLSWNRLTDICDRFDIKCNLTFTDAKTGEIIPLDKPKVVKKKRK